MRTQKRVPRWLLAGGLILISGVALGTAALLNENKQAEALRMAMETLSVTITETATASLTPTETLPPTATRTPKPSATAVPPTPTIGPTYTPYSEAAPAYPLNIAYRGEPLFYGMATDGDSVWISFPERKLIEKRDARTGILQHELLLDYQPGHMLVAAGRLWVYDDYKNLIHKLDADTGAEISRIRCANTNDYPLHFAWDAARQQVWAVDRLDATAFDADTDEKGAVIQLHDWAIEMVVYEGRYFFLLANTNRILVVDSETLEDEPSGKLCDGVLNMVQVQSSLWLVCENDHALIEFDMPSGRVIYETNTASAPYDLFTNGESVWVLDHFFDLIPYDPAQRRMSPSVYVYFENYEFFWVGDLLWTTNRWYASFHIYDFAAMPEAISTPLPPPMDDGEASG